MSKVFKSSPVWTISSEDLIEHLESLDAPDQLYWDSRQLKKDRKKFQSLDWSYWPKPFKGLDGWSFTPPKDEAQVVETDLQVSAPTRERIDTSNGKTRLVDSNGEQFFVSHLAFGDFFGSNPSIDELILALDADIEKRWPGWKAAERQRQMDSWDPEDWDDDGDYFYQEWPGFSLTLAQLVSIYKTVFAESDGWRCSGWNSDPRQCYELSLELGLIPDAWKVSKGVSSRESEGRLSLITASLLDGRKATVLILRFWGVKCRDQWEICDGSAIWDLAKHLVEVKGSQAVSDALLVVDKKAMCGGHLADAVKSALETSFGPVEC